MDTIRVKVYLGALGDASILDEQGMLELSEGATVKDACRALRIPPLLRRLPVTVNHYPAQISQALHDGDSVGFWSLIAGG